MTLTRWTPMARVLNRWPDIWDEDDLSALSPLGGRNDLDVYETDDEVVVKANVAGVAPTDVDITFEKGVLWIKAEKIKEEGDTQKKHYSKSSWNYSYKVAVPGMIDLNHEPKATVEQGVVAITFKKAEASKPRKLTITAK